MSYANSKIPESAQTGVHEGLAERVLRHARKPFRKPYADYNRVAFADSLVGWNGSDPVILDAGCGVGHSTIQLARANPGHWVIGVDQSADRLARRKPYPDALLPTNMVLVRADLVDYWRLLHESGVRLDRHYVLYPNPWPKIGHLARRWHAHPVFPYLPRLGGRFECRTNWRVYIEEMTAALALLRGHTFEWATFEPDRPISPFERKYRDSGQTLFRLEADFDRDPADADTDSTITNTLDRQ